ncbi:MAG: TIGR02300 family protein [Rhodospirillaceae bacterium]
MAKPEWGVKRICQSCSGRYYDFLKSPQICPTCGTTYDPEAALKSRRARPAPIETKPKKIPLAVLQGLGVDVASDEIALELVDDAAPAADIAEALDGDDEEEPEDVPELDDGGDGLEDVIVIEDDER